MCKGKHKREKGLLFFERYVLKPLVTVPGKTIDYKKNQSFYSFINFLLKYYIVFKFFSLF